MSFIQPDETFDTTPSGYLGGAGLCALESPVYFPPMCLFDSEVLADFYHDVSISGYSELTGALDSVPLPQIENRMVEPDQLAEPVLVQRTQLVTSPHKKARSTRTRRRAYVLTAPPPRRDRNLLEFCKVGGCEKWTTKSDKTLQRHRESHFKGTKKVGVKCPSCSKVCSRSGSCKRHLKDCNPAMWKERAKTKGTQDSWGERIGLDVITAQLVDKEYTPLPENRL